MNLLYSNFDFKIINILQLIGREIIKKTMRSILIFCITILFFCNINAQNTSVDFKESNFPGQKKEIRKVLKQIRKGNSLYKESRKGKDFEVLEIFLDENKFNPNNAELNFMIGILYLNTNLKYKSLSYFQNAYKLKPTVTSDIKFRLGEAYQLNHMFDEAIQLYNDYRNSFIKEKELIKYEPIINKKIEECNYGKDFIHNPVYVKLQNMGNLINTKYYEYAPIVNSDNSSLFFTSRRENTTGGKIDKDDWLYFEDIYVSKFDGFKWGIPENLSEINTNKNDAVAGISHDGKKIIIFRGNKNGGEILESENINGSWSSPKKFNKNINTKYHESSAAYSPDGKTLYFCSSRPGGFGESDIYKSDLIEDNQWGPAINIGPTINSPYNESSVYVSNDGNVLYFASNGHTSMGRYDIFKSEFKNNKWSKAENLGYPINTADDDVFFCLTSDNKNAYFSSERENTYGGQDIYYLTFLPDTTKILFVINGVGNKAVSSNIAISFKDSVNIFQSASSDSLTKEVPINVLANNTYFYNVTAEGYFPFSDSIRTFEKEKEKIVNVYLIENKSFVINDSLSFVSNKEVKFNNIYFDYDKYNLRLESMDELDNISNVLRENNEIKIEIGGHTDNIGSYAYNLILSLNRAKSAYNYFVKNKKIDKNRLVYKGYSKSVPMADNENHDGVDNPVGRQLNRRVEFKVIKEEGAQNVISLDNINISSKENHIAENSKYYVIVGSFKSIENAKKKALQLINEGYEGTILESTTNGKYRVCYKSYNVKEDAFADVLMLNKNRKSDNCWILTF